MSDVEFIDFKVVYKGLKTNLTVIEYGNLIDKRVDIHHYLEEIYKQSTADQVQQMDLFGNINYKSLKLIKKVLSLFNLKI